MNAAREEEVVKGRPDRLIQSAKGLRVESVVTKSFVARRSPAATRRSRHIGAPAQIARWPRMVVPMQTGISSMLESVKSSSACLFTIKTAGESM
jgi:hypothetical protein